MSNDSEFVIVWCSIGSRPPRYRHSTAVSAVAEAERLAREPPNAELILSGADEMRQFGAVTGAIHPHPEKEISF